MKKLVLALCLFAPVALAQNTNTNTSGSSSSAGSQSGAISGSISGSNQGQEQGQRMDQGQNQGQNQSASSNQGQEQGQAQSSKNVLGQTQGNANEVGNSNTIIFDNDVPGTQRIKYAPQLGLGVMNPTTPCYATFQGGFSGMGFGVALGGGLVDSECTRRENARMLHAMGENASAVSLLCGNEEVKKRASTLCNRAEQIAMGNAPAQLPVPPSSQPTPAPLPTTPGVAPKPMPLVGEPAVKEYKQDGKTYRWQNGSWQPVMTAPVEEEKKPDLVTQTYPYRPR